jgi:glyoxylase-like metal-dependent hydrolase (beta-lactamase superfamily II)
MSSNTSPQSNTSSTLPQKVPDATVSVHVLSCGHFTLPEHQFVHPVSQEARKSVPSLAFLIEHEQASTGKITRVVFDLGLRRDITKYAVPIQKHIETRQPLTTKPDVTVSLTKGGLSPTDIDYVIYSHVSKKKTRPSRALLLIDMTQVHWDHIGEPRDFPTSTFVVGHGAPNLLKGASVSLRGGHSFFESDLLPEGRTLELSDPRELSSRNSPSDHADDKIDFNRTWEARGSLPRTLDVFGDGSLLIVDAPGHLAGHINLLARCIDGHQVYMAGDACHDRRLLTGEKSIGEWNDAHGQICCIHADRKQAEETIERIRVLEQQGVEIIFAHDVEWENNPANESRFFGAG